MKSKSDMELLAPAGGWEQLEYALLFGADAVYLAAQRFGMRQRASNFTLDEMPRIASYVHERGKKVHVACNTVMHDADLDVLPGYFTALEQAGIDAVIVSDLGAMRLARRYAPNVDLHVSTQASVSNVESALAYRELGAKRIVCAREMSLDAIAKMRSQLPNDLELEAFAHGSMCMAYSGRCLISDYVNGRSALSGHCTQPCRWRYALQEETRSGEYFPIEESEEGSFILNSKDLNMLAHLDDMAAAGIDSIKIEGRNKKAFYVATVVNAYRQVLDGAEARLWEPELETVSHRPYHTGFFYGPAHQTPESDDYVRNYEWVAKVVGCRALDGEGFELDVLCRNKFSVGDAVELLRPHEPVRTFEIERITHITQYGDAPGQHVEVDTAHRTMEHYLVPSPLPACEGDIIRLERS